MNSGYFVSFGGVLLFGIVSAIIHTWATRSAANAKRRKRAKFDQVLAKVADAKPMDGDAL